MLQSTATAAQGRAGTSAGGQGGQRQTKALVGMKASHQTATRRALHGLCARPSCRGSTRPESTAFPAPRGPHSDTLTFSECSPWAGSCRTLHRDDLRDTEAQWQARLPQVPTCQAPAGGPGAPLPGTAQRGLLSTPGLQTSCRTRSVPGQHVRHRAGHRLLVRPGDTATRQPRARTPSCPVLSRCLRHLCPQQLPFTGLGAGPSGPGLPLPGQDRRPPAGELPPAALSGLCAGREGTGTQCWKPLVIKDPKRMSRAQWVTYHGQEMRPVSLAQDCREAEVTGAALRSHEAAAGSEGNMHTDLGDAHTLGTRGLGAACEQTVLESTSQSPGAGVGGHGLVFSFYLF